MSKMADPSTSLRQRARFTSANPSNGQAETRSAELLLLPRWAMQTKRGCVTPFFMLSFPDQARAVLLRLQCHGRCASHPCRQHHPVPLHRVIKEETFRRHRRQRVRRAEVHHGRGSDARRECAWRTWQTTQGAVSSSFLCNRLDRVADARVKGHNTTRATFAARLVTGSKTARKKEIDHGSQFSLCSVRLLL